MIKSEDTSTNKINYAKIKKELITKNGNKCSICRKDFIESDLPEIDHIIPKSLGGTNEIENLQLVCSECNRRKGPRLIYTEAFEDYIKEIIKLSNKYEIIEPKQANMQHRIDIILKDKKKEEYSICEIKTNTVFTNDRIKIISNSLKENCEIIKKKYKNVKKVLIFPGILSPRNIYSLKLNNIEIWDKTYLTAEFKKEILQINNPYMNSIFKIPEEQTQQKTNKYQEKIEKLRKCKAGTENWSDYQKLIGEILELLFCPPLNKPIYEKSDARKINRRDFIMPNYVSEGFWNFMVQHYSADYIVIDAKNSATGVKKQDILQIANYLNKYRNRTIWNYYC